MNWSVVFLLAAPVAASVLLTGALTYLGLHVIERGVIFVDLALAQIAVMGATVALVLPGATGHPGTPLVTWVSLGFTLIGAAVFSTALIRTSRIPREAIVGICYAVAAAASILAMSRAPSESEHLKEMLVGNILVVSWEQVFKMAWLFAGVGAFHLVCRKRFLEISVNHGRTETAGLHVRWWDFLFYASLGIIVTSSVSIAGVLLVFSYLIVPGVAAMLYSDHIGARLAIGWTMGTMVSVVGVYLSVKLDLPTGGTMVCTFGVALLLMALARPFVPWRRA